MKLTRIALALCALAFASTGWGQVYTKFGPVTGVLKGDVNTYQTSAAAAADITTLFGCTTAGQFLNQAGGCTVPAGVTPSGAQNLVYATPNGSSGAATLRAAVGADLPPINLASTANGGVLSTSILLGTNGGTSNGFFSITGPTTSLKTFTFPNASATVLTDNALVTVPQGGTGANTLTNHGVLVGSGTSAVGAVTAMAADTLLQGQGASANPAAVAVNNCGSATQALSYNTTTHAFGCQTISTGTGSVTSVTAGTGLSASPNPIISTGTVSLDLTHANTWTGTQTVSTTASNTFLVSTTTAANLSQIEVQGSAGTAIAGLCTSVTAAVCQANELANDVNLFTTGVMHVSNLAGLDYFRFNSATSGRVADIVGNGTGATAVGYVGWTDQAGTRFGYMGKSSTSSLISYESDADVSLIGNNGTDSLNISTAHKLAYDGVPVIDTGTFTMSYNGFSAGCSLSASYTQAGKMVTLMIPGSAVCASNATTLTGTGIPAAIQPAQTQQLGMFAGLCEDNGVIGGFTCGASITAGTITFSKNNSNSGWTASGQKGVTTNLTVTYLLN